MKTAILLFLLVFSQIALAERIFFLELTISTNDDVKINDFRITTGEPSLPFSSQNYTLKLFDVMDKLLFDINLPVSFTYHAETPEGSVIFEREEVTVIIKPPFFADAGRMEIYRGEKLILRFDINEYICNGNTICEGDENNLNCPSDCSSRRDNYCLAEKDDVCDPDCMEEQDPDCGKVLGPEFIFIGLILIIGGAVLLFFMKKRRNAVREEYILKKIGPSKGAVVITETMLAIGAVLAGIILLVITFSSIFGIQSRSVEDSALVSMATSLEYYLERVSASSGSLSTVYRFPGGVNMNVTISNKEIEISYANTSGRSIRADLSNQLNTNQVYRFYIPRQLCIVKNQYDNRISISEGDCACNTKDIKCDPACVANIKCDPSCYTTRPDGICDMRCTVHGDGVCDPDCSLTGRCDSDCAGIIESC